MNEVRPIRLLVADDHPFVREGVISILNRQSDMRVIAEAASGKEAIASFRQHQPDITLMDLQMRDGDGLAAIRAIRKESPKARILVLTAYDGDENIFQAIQSGARGYLLKTAPCEQLLETIRAVNNERTFFSPEVASQLAVRLNRPALTIREQEVLEHLAKGKSNLEIGSALFITEGTVKSHVNRIFSKLGVSDRTQATVAAIKHGLIHLS